MKFLDTTAGSTHATNIAVKLYMPPTEAATVLAYLNRCQELEAKQPDHAHARDSRTKDIEALVLLALSNATLNAAVMAVSPCFRATKVRDHLRYHLDRYNILKPPTRDTIKAVLIKHRYMF